MALVVAVVFLFPVKSTLLTPIALVGVPTAAALLVGGPRGGYAGMLGVALLGVAILGVGAAGPIWFLERGWAVMIGGVFAALRLAWPRAGIAGRAIASVAVAFAAATVLALAVPGWAEGVDWQVAGYFDALPAAAVLPEGTAAALVESYRQVVELLKLGYPALAALGSIAALAVAGYIVGRVAGDEAPLGAFREFRFADAWVWLLVLGLLLTVAGPGGGWVRVGGNLVAAMGVLYVVRGTSVLAWLATSVVASWWSVALWLLAAVLLWPVTIGTTVVMGLSDTWLDLRSRLRVGRVDE